MSIQEAALYGDLVLALRDYAAGQVAVLTPERDLETACAQMDEFIRTWFFTPQKELYGSAPRELIWREQLGEQNPLPKEYAAEAFGDDCPICQAMREEIENAEDDAAYGHFWGYSPDTCLLEQYDPEGAEERWRKESARMSQADSGAGYAAADLPPQLTADEFLSVLRRPWLDPEFHRAAQKLAEYCDVPQPARPGQPPYRRITRDEALSVISGLQQQGVKIQAVMEQIDAWPYSNIALDWFSDPEHNAALVCQAMEDAQVAGDLDEMGRFRVHRDFIFALARLVPPGARLWLSGWLKATTYAAMQSPF